MEEGISGSKDTIEEMDTLVKEDLKSKIIMSQNIQESWDTKTPTLRITGTERGRR